MNFDEIKGKVQNAFGKAEETVGEAVGSQNLSNAGAEDRLKGAAKETWGNAKDAFSEAGTTASSSAADARNSAAYEAGRAEGHVDAGHASLRDCIVSGAEHLKDQINEKIDHFKEDQREKRN